MKKHIVWAPFVASVVATPVFLFILVGTAGAGHADNRGPACTLFPYAMLAGVQDMPFFALLVVQLPLYGLALGAAARRGRFLLALVLVIAVHAAAAAACLGTVARR